MKKSLKILRFIVVTAITLLIAIPISLYILLSSSWAQDDIRKAATAELSRILATEVNIGSVNIHPFNRLSINDITANDDNGEPAMSIKEISVGFELLHLLRTGRLVVDYVLVDAPYVKIYKTSTDAPLNIAGIIERFKPGNDKREDSHYDIKANTVVIRKGIVRYDVIDADERPDSVFDSNHILVRDIFVNAYIPEISNDGYRLEIDRLSFAEISGFTLSDLKAAGQIDSKGLLIDKFEIELPNSELSFQPITKSGVTPSTISTILDAPGINIELTPESHIYLADLKSFVPQFGNSTLDFGIGLSSKLSRDEIALNELAIYTDAGDAIVTAKALATTFDNRADMALKGDVRFNSSTAEISQIATNLGLQAKIGSALVRLGADDAINASIVADGKLSQLRYAVDLSAATSRLRMMGDVCSKDSLKSVNITSRGNFALPILNDLDLVRGLDNASGQFAAEAKLSKIQKWAKIELDSMAVNYNGHLYRNIFAEVEGSDNYAKATVTIVDPLINLYAQGSARRNRHTTLAEAVIDITDADLHEIGLISRYEGRRLGCSIDAIAEFSNLDDINGTVSIENLTMTDDDNRTNGIAINKIALDLTPDGGHPGIDFTSDIFSAHLNGRYQFSTLGKSLKTLTSMVFPVVDEQNEPLEQLDIARNDFTFDVRVDECERLCSYLELPVSVIYPVTIVGHVSDTLQSAAVRLDAPYLIQGDKLYEGTSLDAALNAYDDRASLYATTKFPTKKGNMALVAKLSGADNRIDSHIDWLIERAIPINGTIDFSTLLTRVEQKPAAHINFNPGTITFGDDLWKIKPSTIDLLPDAYYVDQFALEANDKSININGVVSQSDDILRIDLKDITLLDIFETLEINNALIGGNATGRFICRKLLTGEPEIYCRNLHVDDISYNRCVVGNADIAANWDDESKSFYLDADITGLGGEKSRIYGNIFPADEALNINFDVNHAPVGFLKPFMSAFASDLTGYASGKARMFGTFKYIDMEGDIYADDIKIKIDFTNTWYGATDSIRLTPGRIDIDNVTVTDVNGHTATLNGVVNHTFFKEPSFDFSVTNARDFLCYNVDSHISPDWYGTIYGNGSASIKGEPGVVNIGVNMTTAQNSTFTFVLSDRLNADEYTFITFTNKRAQQRRDSLLAADKVPTLVRELKSKLENTNNDSPSAYNMDIQVDITNQAQMILVMDPVGGDEIKATGSGNLRLTYESLNNDLKMYGIYRLEKGKYNFTLQDIIIKDFTIKAGSTIAFHGDPYSAQLDIEAIYGVYTNLSDLDESFLMDKDLNRTNVPVNALMFVKGDMRQPEISFDLEFPSLSEDVYRKVKSIVSTEDMMNRQIIYLLALNRFYTPDYMASTTKGNELFSVASSTISSQLGSMLGKLSNSWSIAPNLRSDRGDFSDVEVDVALSSRLLNNRLLFNGNFGYRDKTLNTNQFIGDFDVEYLLNPTGSWRLKAYNRYNDQNYYVRTAQTTQGLGLVFKKDFNNFFNFLHPKKKDKPKEIIIPDSIAHPSNPLLD